MLVIKGKVRFREGDLVSFYFRFPKSQSLESGKEDAVLLYLTRYVFYSLKVRSNTIKIRAYNSQTCKCTTSTLHVTGKCTLIRESHVFPDKIHKKTFFMDFTRKRWDNDNTLERISLVFFDNICRCKFEPALFIIGKIKEAKNDKLLKERKCLVHWLISQKYFGLSI